MEGVRYERVEPPRHIVGDSPVITPEHWEKYLSIRSGPIVRITTPSTNGSKKTEGRLETNFPVLKKDPNCPPGHLRLTLEDGSQVYYPYSDIQQYEENMLPEPNHPRKH